MKYRIVLLGTAAVAVVLLVVGQSPAPAAAPLPGMKAGFAEADITPDIGMEQPGGYGKSYHTKLHDRCKVRAAVFDDGHQRVLILAVDALAIQRDTVDAARRQISEKTNIPADAILIAASHSHSSGPLSGVQPSQFDDAPLLVRKLAYEQSTMVNPTYRGLVEKQLVIAGCRADAARADIRAGAGKGREDQVAFNRRFRMKNGLTYSHPGVGNPDIVEPAGPTDPEVGVIGAWSKDGLLLGCVVNFACHATTSPGGISANYIYYIEQAVRGFFGPQVIVVFLAGASGDVTQVNNLSPSARPEDEQWARLVGGRVGAEAVKVLVSMQPGALVPVAARSKLLQIKHRVPAPDRVRQALEMVQKEPKQVGVTDWIFAKETVLLDAILKKSPVAEVEVQVLQIGPVALMANPSEYFCQFGLDLKKQSPFPLTFPVTLANGRAGYVPTEEAFGPHGGGYETRLTSYSNLDVTAGRQIADTALNLARQLRPGSIPTPGKPPPFKAGWTYGNVPPQRE